MRINGDTVKDHVVEHEILGVKSQTTLDLRYLKLNQSTPQTLTTSPIIDNLTAGNVMF